MPRLLQSADDHYCRVLLRRCVHVWGVEVRCASERRLREELEERRVAEYKLKVEALLSAVEEKGRLVEGVKQTEDGKRKSPEPQQSPKAAQRSRRRRGVECVWTTARKHVVRQTCAVFTSHMNIQL